MPPIFTHSQRAASALRRAEKALRNWQDDPESPRADVDKMLAIVSDLRIWVQAHVLADIERAEDALREHRSSSPISTSTPPPPGPGAYFDS